MNEPAPPADERVAYGDHASQFIDFRCGGPPARPLAIMIHGGFWRARIDLTHEGHFCAAAAAAGLTTANIEYRRAGEAGGGWPGTVDDVRRAVAFARGRFPDAPAVLLGHSAGGHLALCIAGEMPDLKSVIALAPVADPRRAYELNLGSGAVAEFFGGSPEELPERYAMPRPVCPVTILHGTADEIVPVELSRGYPGARVIEIPGADHFDPIDPLTAPFQDVLRCVLTASAPPCRPSSRRPHAAPQ
jgi:acetyl esterase/lipase